MTDWTRAFFAGSWLDVQRSFWAAEQTDRQAQTIARLLALAPRSRVLDVPCGTGRISCALARLGHEVTGVDFTADLLADARAAAGDLPVTFLERDMRELKGLGGFAAAINYWGSFGYFDEAGNEALAAGVCAALVPGGRFLIDLNLMETLMPIFQPKGWYTAGELTILEDRTFDFVASRIEVDWTFFRQGREEQRRHTSERLYTAHELVTLLRRSGFASVRLLDAVTEGPLRVGSRRAVVIATK